MAKEVFTLDGGKISELERLGVGNFDFLSCHDEGDEEQMVSTLENIHLSYLLAGCNVISTNTFQVNLHSLQEKGISVQDGEGIVDRYIDIAHRALLRYEGIKRSEDFPLFHLCPLEDSSPYEHLEGFQQMRNHLGIVHPKDSVNTREYVDSFDLSPGGWGGSPIRRCPGRYVAFATGGYSAAFRDFSEYSGVMRKGGAPGKAAPLGNAMTSCKPQNQQYDIFISTPTLHADDQPPSIKMIPVSSRESGRERGGPSREAALNRHLFNYGLEYYVDVGDEEIISNCNFKLGAYKRNEEKLHLFSLLTSSNVREVLTLYSHLVKCGGHFDTNVVVSFYCNDGQHIGCSGYSFVDVVLILLYLDSRNRFIKAIGLNCVSIDSVRELFAPLTRCISSDGTVDVDAYGSPSGELSGLTKTILKGLKKNRFLGDIHFFASPNKSLNRVTYDYEGGEVHFETTQERHKHVCNYVGEWLHVGLSGFGGCCYYNPYDISLLDYKLGQLAGGVAVREKQR
ncbi:unnamed protein product [Plasmodium vivax]|uniref:(malaria parasite P. vivax) hypothetical protein n=1 Tax=Plasmodium vivax TaxID=5855 RepID=A0A8S4H875_PLAVI|nr:unnamed protein product [Plasmodium vivax]